MTPPSRSSRPARGGILARAVRIGLAAISAISAIAALVVSGSERASALEFRCIEASRYKHLLQVFGDDTQAFANHFGIDKADTLDPGACRALVVSGVVQAGDAETLIDHIAQNKGWLAIIFLAAQGAAPEEEVKLAHVIRRFGLKTRAVTATKFRYEPDFATRIVTASRASAEGELAQAAAMASLDAGLRDFLRRDDLDVVVPDDRAGCVESCIGLWLGGMSREAPRQPAAANVPAGSRVSGPATRVRAALLAELDGGAVPQSSDPALHRVVALGALDPAAPAATRAVREACAAEIAAVEAVSARVAAMTDDLARRDFRAIRSDSLSQQFVSLRRAGIRLQQCTAGALERERLVRYRRLCPQGCERERISAAAAEAARTVLQSVAR